MKQKPFDSFTLDLPWSDSFEYRICIPFINPFKMWIFVSLNKQEYRTKVWITIQNMYHQIES